MKNVDDSRRCAIIYIYIYVCVFLCVYISISLSVLTFNPSCGIPKIASVLPSARCHKKRAREEISQVKISIWCSPRAEQKQQRLSELSATLQCAPQDSALLPTPLFRERERVTVHIHMPPLPL